MKYLSLFFFQFWKRFMGCESYPTEFNRTRKGKDAWLRLKCYFKSCINNCFPQANVSVFKVTREKNSKCKTLWEKLFCGISSIKPLDGNVFVCDSAEQQALKRSVFLKPTNCYSPSLLRKEKSHTQAHTRTHSSAQGRVKPLDSPRPQRHSQAGLLNLPPLLSTVSFFSHLTAVSGKLFSSLWIKSPSQI